MKKELTVKEFIEKLKDLNQDIKVRFKVDGTFHTLTEDTDYEIYKDEIYIGEN